jgi:uncharacterized protein (TIGR03066 family)
MRFRFNVFLGFVLGGLVGCSGPDNATRSDRDTPGGPRADRQTKEKRPAAPADPEKLLGTWDMVSNPLEAQAKKEGRELKAKILFRFDFFKDGQLKKAILIKDEAHFPVEETYQLEGSNLTIDEISPFGQGTRPQKYTVEELTDTSLILRGPEGNIEFKRKK